jgi:hypothetical protein
MGQPSEGLTLQNKRMANHQVRRMCVVHPALGAKSKLYLLPVNIKLGLIRISVKAMDK